MSVSAVSTFMFELYVPAEGCVVMSVPAISTFRFPLKVVFLCLYLQSRPLCSH